MQLRTESVEEEGKPESFDFLGFTHICGRKQNGKFVVLRHTIRSGCERSLKDSKESSRNVCMTAIPELGKWLQLSNTWTLSDIMAYHETVRAVKSISLSSDKIVVSNYVTTKPEDVKSIGSGCNALSNDGCHILESCIRILNNDSTLLPKAGAQCGSTSRWDLCGGYRATGIPTAILNSLQKIVTSYTSFQKAQKVCTTNAMLR